MMMQPIFSFFPFLHKTRFSAAYNNVLHIYTWDLMVLYNAFSCVFESICINSLVWVQVHWFRPFVYSISCRCLSVDGVSARYSIHSDSLIPLKAK